MEIPSTRLTPLLKEALTPQPVPTAKADPATAALVKALVQPPLPSAAPSTPFTAPALNRPSQQTPIHVPQRSYSGEAENAYRAIMELDEAAESPSARAPAARHAADADQASRGVIPLQPRSADNTGTAATVAPLSVAAATASSGVLFAANSNARQSGGRNAAPPGHAPRSEPRPPTLLTMSIVTALVSAATTMVVLLLLR